MTAVYTFVKSDVARVTNKLTQGYTRQERASQRKEERADLRDSLLGLWTPDAYFNSPVLSCLLCCLSI